MDQPLHEACHEGPLTPVFTGRDVRLGIGALTLDVDHFEISHSRRTWVKEASNPVERELHESLAGVIFGHGNVEFSRSRGSIEVDAEEQAIVPNGRFEELSAEEQAEHPAAEWKFSFDYTEPPTVHPM
jgi:hypothetical protein